MTRTHRLFSSFLVLFALVVAPSFASAQPTLEVTPRTYRISQPSLSPVEIPAVETLSSAATFYDFFSASSHTGFEAVGRSLLFLHRDVRAGQDNVSMIVTHGIDQTTSGQSQPTADVDMTITGVPSTTTVQVSDDAGEFTLSGSTATGNWAFANNTDGGVLGLFPNDSDWSMTVDIALNQGITEWQYYYAGGSNVVLDATEPLTIEYNSPLPNTSWETRTISGADLTLCAAIDSATGNTSTYSFTWNDTVPDVDAGTTSSDSEVVCGEHTFAASGLYTLDIVADDGTGTATATVTIYVEDPTPIPVSITTPVDGSTITTDTTAVAANTDPLASVDLYVDGVFAASGFADMTGLVTFSTADVGQLAEGDHSVELIVGDSLGNGGIARADFTVDTVAALALTTPSVTPFSTSDDTPEFAGTTEEGADIEVEIVDAQGNTVETLTESGVAAPGDWSVIASSLADGTYSYTVTATDAAGNTATITGDITVDTTSQVAITAPSTDPAFTNDDTPTISGTSEPGASVNVSFEDTQGNVTNVTATVDAQGDWNATAPQLSEDTYIVTASAIDALGNPAATDALDLTVDLTTAVTITSPTDGQTDDDPTVSFAGTAESESVVTVTIRDSSGQVVDTFATVTGSGTTWSETSATLADATYDATVEATDLAGNTATQTVSFTVDTTTNVAIDAIGNGGVVNSTTPTITGSAEAGASVEVTFTDSGGTETTVNATATGGTWSVTPTLAEGSYTVEAEATDALGNTASATTSMEVDTTSPALAIISPSENDNVTNDFSVIGQTDANEEVTVTVDGANGTSTLTATADANGDWQADFTGITAGTSTVTAEVTDTAGNTSTEVISVTVFDVELSIDQPLDGQALNDPLPALAGRTAATTTVNLTLNPGPNETTFTTIADSNGDWYRFPPNSLADGDYTLVASVDDGMGGTREESVAFSVDTVAPAVVIYNPTDGAQLTDDEPTIDGASDPGATVTVVIDGGTPDEQTIVTTADMNGDWSISVDEELADGPHSVVASSTDDAGNTGSATVTFEVDATPPALAIQTPADGETTGDTTPLISGQTEAGVNVEISIDGMVANTVTADANGLYSFEPMMALSDGNHTISVVATDDAGNQSSESVTFTVDSSAPFVVIVSPTEDSTVASTTPDIRGEASPNTSVEIFVGGVSAGTATSDANGMWTFTIPVGSALVEGENTIRAEVDDGMGGVVSSEVSFEVDTMAPTVSVTTPVENGLVTSPNPAISGTTEADAAVEVEIDGVVYQTQADENGDWSLVISGDLADGPYTANVTATDAAGNAGMTDVNFEVDTVAPSVRITFPDNDTTINNTQPDVRGITEPNATVTVVIDEGSATEETLTTTADANGVFSVTPATLSNGVHTASASVSDAAGNTGTASVEFIVDTRAPDVSIVSPTEGEVFDKGPIEVSGTASPGSEISVLVDGVEEATTTADANGDWSVTVPALPGRRVIRATATDSMTGLSANAQVSIDIIPPDPLLTIDSPAAGAVTSDTTPDIAGTANPGEVVEVFIDGVSVGTVTADMNGDWSLTAPDVLTDGSYMVRAEGEFGGDATVSFEVDTMAPGITLDSPTNGSTVGGGGITLRGTSEPGSTVEVFVDGEKVGETTANTDGDWTFEVDDLPEGDHELEVETTDDAGNTGSSGVVVITVDTTAPEVTVTVPEEGEVYENTPEFGGTSEPGTTIIIVIDGGEEIEVTVGDDGGWTFQPDDLGPGEHTVIVTGRDDAGNSSDPIERTFVVDTDDTDVPDPVSPDLFVEGGGCSTPETGSSLPLSLLVLLGVFLLGFTRRRERFAAFAAVFLIAIPAADAQLATDVNAENFEPLPTQTTNTLNVARSEVLGHLEPSFGLFVHLSDDPLQLGDGNDGVQFRLIDTSLKTEISAAIGLFEYVDIGVIMPLVVFQEGDAAPVVGIDDELDSFALSDLRVVPKIRFVNPEWTGGFGAALLVPVSLPTGDDVFNSDGTVVVEPRLAVDFSMAWGFKVAANIGYEIQDETAALNYVAGDSIKWGAAAEVPLAIEELLLQASIVGAAPLEDGVDIGDGNVSNDRANPIEALGGLKWFAGNGLLAQVGGGAGLTDGVGAPDFRVFAGIEWAGIENDADGDGILDGEDQCPESPEDKDGYEDSDGCPDLDNDEDTVLDESDGCPNEAEDMDGFEDEDGCPDPDNDEDGVLDSDDECPETAGPAENNGCPWGDRDKDGLMDNEDQCPEEPEDKDGFQDEDGCPDLDNDGDRIADAVDKCPLEPEVINGVEDADGCPDKGESKVKVTEKKIEILEKVYFDTNKATIKQQSFNILNQVASVLKLYPQIKKVRVEGHTDSRGSAKYNLKLSKERAKSVMDYLVARGVEADRLESEGFGEDQPIADNGTATGRDQNRRVEFTIIKSEKILEKKVVEEPEVTNAPE